MSHGYVPVQWNRRKIIYDLCVWFGIALYLGLFVGVSVVLYSGPDALSLEIVLIRALATCAFVMLTMILCIGPLARFDKRFLPLLYNRRHFGVSMFVVALAHGILALFWYHGFGVISPLASLLETAGPISSLIDVPFQPLGLAALCILFLMAATSHDYWNTNLGAPLWKALHMFVYVAYALLVAHISLGALQEPNTGISVPLVMASVALVGGLHLAAAIRESGPDLRIGLDEWVDVGSWREIADNCAVTVTVGDQERVAVFRYNGDKLAAVGNACQHQNGPLGEGKVIDGCITCPWHGFQYRPEDGCSPAPFTEKIPTFRLRLEGERVLLDPTALPRGTARPVLQIPGAVA